VEALNQAGYSVMGVDNQGSGRCVLREVGKSLSALAACQWQAMRLFLKVLAVVLDSHTACCIWCWLVATISSCLLTWSPDCHRLVVRSGGLRCYCNSFDEYVQDALQVGSTVVVPAHSLPSVALEYLCSNRGLTRG
jgi:hypothetical protein